MSDKLFKAIVLPNPFDASDRETLDLPVDGKSLAELFATVKTELAVSVNGRNVYPVEYPTLIPKSGDVLVVATMPDGGDDGGGKTILRLVATVALMYFTMGAGGMAGGSFLGATGAAGAMAAGAVFIGGTMLINALLPMEMPKIDVSMSESPSNSYGIDGPKNTSREGTPVPLVFGKYRIAGNIISSSTENIDKIQIYKALYNFGEGEISALTDIEVNKQPASQYNSKIEIRKGSDTQSIIADFEAVEVADNYGYVFDDSYENDPQNSRLILTNEKVIGIGIDLLMPQGLYRAYRDGSNGSTSLKLEILYREEGANESAWRHFETGVLKNLADLVTMYVEVPANEGGTEVIAENVGWAGNSELFPKKTITYDSKGAEILTESHFDHNDYRLDSFYAKVTNKTFIGEINLEFPSKWDLYATPLGSSTAVLIGRCSLGSNSRNINGLIQRHGQHILVEKVAAPFRRTLQSGYIPSAKYEIKMTRLTPKSPNDDPDRRYSTYDNLTLTDVRKTKSSEDSPDGAGTLRYIHTAILAIRVEVTNQLNSIPNITGVSHGIRIPTYTRNASNTTQFDMVMSSTSNPAWIVYSLYTNQRWGGKFDPNRLILEEFVEWAEFCDENNLEFNGVIDSQMNIWDAVKIVSRNGRASPIPVGTRIGLNIMQAKLPSQLFSSANIIEGSLNLSWLPMKDRANTIDCAFYDEENNFLKREFRFHDNSVAEGNAKKLRATDLNLLGVTNYAQAAAECVFSLNHNKLSQTISFETPTAGIAVRIGDVVNVQHDLPSWGEAGKVEGGSGRTVNLDREVEMTAGKEYSVLLSYDALVLESANVIVINAGTAVRINEKPPLDANRLVSGDDEYEIVKIHHVTGTKYDVILNDAQLTNGAGMWVSFVRTDAMVTRTVATVPGSTKYLELKFGEPSLTTPPQLGMNFSFGEKEKAVKPFLVTSVSGKGTENRTIDGIEYSDATYDDSLTDTMPSFSSLTESYAHVFALTISEKLIGPSTRQQHVVEVTWAYDDANPTQLANVYVSKDSSDWVLFESNATTHSVIPVEEDLEDVKVKIVTVKLDSTEYLPRSAPTVERAIGLTIVPLSVINVASTYSTDNLLLTWQEDKLNASDPDALLRYEVWVATSALNPSANPAYSDVLNEKYWKKPLANGFQRDHVFIGTTLEKSFAILNLDTRTRYYIAIVTTSATDQANRSIATEFIVNTPNEFAEFTDAEIDAQNKADAALQSAKDYADNKFIDSIEYGVDLAEMQSQIDGNITTWFEDGVPTLTNMPVSTWTTTALKNQHLGDIYYDDATGFSYRFKLAAGVYSWVKIDDSDITKALSDASKAQDTADGKRRVFVIQPITPYDVGDLWDTGAGFSRCKVAKLESQSYSSSDWLVVADLTDYDDDRVSNDQVLPVNGTASNSYLLGGLAQTAFGVLASARTWTASQTFNNGANVKLAQNSWLLLDSANADQLRLSHDGNATAGQAQFEFRNETQGTFAKVKAKDFVAERTLLENGSASLPALTFGGDTDTGFFRLGGGHVGVSCNNVHQLSFKTGSYGLDMHSNIHMNNKGVYYTNELHFNSNTRLSNSNDSRLYMKFGNATKGEMQFASYAGTVRKGSIFYDGSGFGLVNKSGQWAVRTTATETQLFYDGVAKLTTKNEGVSVTGQILATAKIQGLTLGVDNALSNSGRGISLYGGANVGKPTYGLMFAGTSTFGNHGFVTGDWATYFTTHGASNRGWIFNHSSNGNIASIDGAGNAHFNGSIRESGILLSSKYLSIGELNYNSSSTYAAAWASVEAFKKWMLTDDDTVTNYDTVTPSLAAGFLNATIGQFNLLVANKANVDYISANAVSVGLSDKAINENPYFKTAETAASGNSALGWVTVNAALTYGKEITDGSQGNVCHEITSGTSVTTLSEPMPIVAGKTYKISRWVRHVSGERRNQYTLCRFNDVTGAQTKVGAIGWSSGGYLYWGQVNKQLPEDGSWEYQEATFSLTPETGDAVTKTVPPTAVEVQIGALNNYSGTGTETIQVQNYRVEEMSDHTTIVDGTITAKKLNIEDVFAQEINASGTITGATIKTTNDGNKDLTIIDSDTIKHIPSGETEPIFMIGNSFGENNAVLQLGINKVVTSASDISALYQQRLLHSVAHFDAASHAMINFGLGDTLSLYNHSTSASNSIQGQALRVESKTLGSAIASYNQGVGAQGGHGLAATSAGREAAKFTSASGFAPFLVNSATKVNNLNADQVDGYHASTTRNSANTIPVRNASGQLDLGWIKTTSGLTASAASDYYVNTNDGYIRKKTLTNVRAEIVVAADILTKLKTVDGAASGLDAQYLAGESLADIISTARTNVDAATLGGYTLSSVVAAARDSVGLNADTLDNINSGSFLRSDTTDYQNNTIYQRGYLVNETGYRNRGVYGSYDSAKTNHIWSMGVAYKNSQTGANFGNLYGLAYKHTNNPTGGTMAGGHQMVWCENGVGKSAIGTNIWTSGSVNCALLMSTGDIYAGTNGVIHGDVELAGVRTNRYTDTTFYSGNNSDGLIYKNTKAGMRACLGINGPQRTTLFSGNQSTGNITLSQSLTNFDAFVVVYTTSSGDNVSQDYHDIQGWKDRTLSDQNPDDYFLIKHRDGYYIVSATSDSSLTLTRDASSGCYLRKIYGITY